MTRCIYAFRRDLITSVLAILALAVGIAVGSAGRLDIVRGAVAQEVAQNAAPEPTRGAIIATIESQIDAFQRDDAAGAFTHASPNIQRIFPTPDIFMDMVRQGYQAVYRPREVTFLDLAPEGGRWVQRVLFVGPDGVPVIASYFMIQDASGRWLIDGVIFEEGSGLAA
ncbi:MAG: DUF4864 domain-containing protein [Azospirillaceae bacterium]